MQNNEMSILSIKISVLSPSTLNMERYIFVEESFRDTFSNGNDCSRAFSSQSHSFILEHLRTNSIIGIACAEANLDEDLASLGLE